MGGGSIMCELYARVPPVRCFCNFYITLELPQRGYETAEDMAHLATAKSVRIPGVGGR